MVSQKEFQKSFFLEEIPALCLSALLYAFMIYVCEHMALWTNNYQVSINKAFILTSIIFIGVGIFILLAMVVSLIVLKKQYTFTPLQEGTLKDKIMALQETSKKKVNVINVYDESKKSTSKNAFLLRFLWHREFGIADNFLNENAEDELLAVLSHEIGHLKHKKSIWNYLSYLLFVAFFFALLFMISHGQIIVSLTKWLHQSFALTTTNYYLTFLFYIHLFNPINALISVYASNITRLEEYEADREAVKNGYGEALIKTFKQLSSDELINVNPAPIIEFLEYDHPGMYRRIKAIQEANAKLDKSSIKS